jgi:hypothetical protein
MGGVTTTYDVVTRYMTQNHGGPAVQQMTTQVQALERSTSSAKSIFASLGAAAAGFLGFEAGKKHLIDFNSEMEQAKITSAGFMTMSGLGSFNENMAKADDLVKQYTIDARASIGTTADFVAMSKSITSAVTNAGGGVKELHDMTKGLVIASKSMNMDPQFAAMETEEALMGNITMRNRFARKMLQPLGYSDEEGRKKYQQLSASKRLAEFQRALGGEWLKSMTGAQEHSFEGAKSTFIDNAQLAALRTGKPMFEAIKRELNQWNDFLIRNQTSIDHIADVVGGKLLQAAISFKNAIQWTAEHWKTIAASIGIMKAAGYLAGGAGGMVGSAVGGTGSAAGAMVGATFGTKVAAASIIASAVYIGATELTEWIARRQDEGIRAQGAAGEALIRQVELAADNPAKIKAMKDALSASGFMAGDSLDKAAFERAMSASDLKQRGQWSETLGVHRRGDTQWMDEQTDPAKLMEAMVRWVERWRTPAFNMMDDIQPWRMPGGKDVPMPKIEKPKVNVTIHKIEVASDDPDRFSFGFINALRDVARNPSSVGNSIRVLREG